jgi:hypothetical protein
MPLRCLSVLSVLVTVTAVGSLTPVPVAGQAQTAANPKTTKASARTPKRWTLPRVPWGDPDLQGIWNHATLTPLERPSALAGKDILTDEEAAEFERQTLQQRDTSRSFTGGPEWWDSGTRVMKNNRTSLIVDPQNGRIPPLIPEAQKRAAVRAEASRGRGPVDSFEDRSLEERCIMRWTAGPPIIPGPYNNNFQLFQTREYVVIFNEMIHDARIVPIDGRPHGSIRRWMGDSRGHWEGDTLVVDTVNFTDKTNFRGSGENLHLIERFTRVDGDTIEYRFTADDSTTWTRPWTAAFPLTKINDHMYEYACHEGNYRTIVGMLRGARAEEKAGGAPIER